MRPAGHHGSSTFVLLTLRLFTITAHDYDYENIPGELNLVDSGHSVYRPLLAHGLLVKVSRYNRTTSNPHQGSTQLLYSLVTHTICRSLYSNGRPSHYHISKRIKRGGGLFLRSASRSSLFYYLTQWRLTV